MSMKAKQPIAVMQLCINIFDNGRVAFAFTSGPLVDGAIQLDGAPLVKMADLGDAGAVIDDQVGARAVARA
jgi:hypothetical protein